MTAKQKRAALKTLENGGNVSKAMREVGYSASVAKNPQKLTQSKGWEEFLDEYFPDSKLLEVGKNGLDATKLATSFTEADQFIPDWPTRHKYLETALKLKKRLGQDEKAGLTINAESINVVWSNGVKP